jgi:hypothetical protein
MTNKEQANKVQINEPAAVISESARSLKTFRSSQELETLISFVHENGLRREIFVAMDAVIKAIKPKKKTRAKKVKVLH